MKKTYKRALGLVGLGAVVATTFFAANLPGPEAAATDVTSVTDTISVRVVSTDVNVTLTSPADDSEFLDPNQTVAYTYENVEWVRITLEYTDRNGNVYDINSCANPDIPYDPNNPDSCPYLIDKIFADYNPGDGSNVLNLNSYGPSLEDPNYDYGYGEYKITARGDGINGLYSEDVAEFGYYPVVGAATQNKDTWNVDVNLDYDKTNEDITEIILNVYDADGNLITGLSPVELPVPLDKTTISLDFAKYGLEDGTYKITATAYDAEGNIIYLPYIMYVNFENEPVPTPNTGGLFQNLNISSTDYLVTGLVVFGIVAVAGATFIVRNKRK